MEEKKEPQALVLGVKNDGCASPPGILRLYVSDREKRFRVGGGLDPGLPAPGRIRQCRVVLPPGVKWDSGLRLSAELEFRGRRYPVRWACREPLNEDGSLTIRATAGLKI